MLRRKFSLALLSLCLVLAAGLAIYWQLARKAPRYNIVLISIDTLRSDRLGIYGYGRPTSPVIDRIGSRGTVFKNVVAESSWTLPSHVSMLSGLHPVSHGVHDKTQRIPKSTRLLQEHLQTNGYRTIGFADGGYVAKHFGFERGFDTFNSNRKGFVQRIGKAIEALEGVPAEQPFFLFLHTYDVHCPYVPPEPYFSMFHSPDAVQIDTRGCGGGKLGKRKLSAGEVRYTSDRYDGGIRHTDANLEQLLRYLENRSLLEKTILVITSDHGEAFYEHNRLGHQGTLFREVLFVPLIISGPGVVPQMRSDPVNLSDITPTLLQLAGVAATPLLDGRSLSARLAGDEGEQSLEQSMISVLRRKREISSLISFPFHLIVQEHNRKAQLFDIVRDPEERHNLIEKHPELLAELSSKLELKLRSFRRGEVTESSDMDDEKLEDLKSLGYLG